MVYHVSSSSSPTLCPPPVPETGTDPNRVLLNHWSEYIHLSGRKYYYNSVTKQSSWKPPRHGLIWFCKYDSSGRLYFYEQDGAESYWQLPDHGTDEESDKDWQSQSDASESYSPITKDLPEDVVVDVVSTGVTSFTSSFSSKLKPSPTTPATTTPTSSSSTTTTKTSSHQAPSSSSGSRIINEGSLRLATRKQKHYVNHSYMSPIERSFKAKSMVFLPTNGDRYVNHTMDSDSEEPRLPSTNFTSCSTTSHSTMSTAKPVAPPTPPITAKTKPMSFPLNSPTVHSSSSSSSSSPSPSSSIHRPTWTNNIHNRTNKNTIHHNNNNNNNHGLNHHTVYGSLNHHHSYQTPPVPENLEESRAFKTGILNRTKIMENGKRLRKNWSTSLVALSDHYLLIFKDAKINSQEENLKPEIAIELGGSLIEWSQGLSSRKNVFQLTTFMGNQLLLQEDCSLTAAEWFYSIKSAISKLPKCDGTATIGSNCFMETGYSNKECKLKRSKSTKQACKKLEMNSKSIAKNGGASGPGEENQTPEKNRKIRERLINFLLRRPTLDSLREKGIFKDGPVFGCDLYSLCSREKQLVPKVVQQCIKAIETKGLKADGIYRVCGNLSEVQKIRYQVNHDNYDGIWAQEDVHVLTGALKLFFRDMKEPLFPCNRFDSLMFTIGLPDAKKKQEAIVRVIRDLPKCNKETLKYLLKHLLRVQDHKDENRMHIQNLAIVFGPTLMWPETDSNNLAYDMMLKMHSNQVIELLLLEFNQIFT